ncbi:diaminobutyrate--2-oxoglutarate transaminase [Microbacterium sp. RU33B]|uniref:diaminobutyrate--2-oxoglutarate transaminase n=1 Tax=Microbacterium sp. RU33B TaxID=1907390 RepID=UPI00095BC428|nr:diaminobutyrate--2-oxoglutarate transaminase [Microbacterium sp. RU33B]SIT74618.1 diaminobutyrate aminotransferase apoenzyme [Microbacterium sp. RU33B]
MDLSVFSSMESEVRSYIRSFPTVFDTARGSILTDEDGRDYIDFFCGAGTLNYGHNNPLIKAPVVEYLMGDKIQHALDMATGAKRHFLEVFRDVILAPRGLEYKLQFPGPTGANAVEAAMKLARIKTGRSTIVAFTHGYHGLSLGALAATANSWFRDGAGVGLNDVVFHPFDGYYGPDIDTVAMLRKLVEDPSSGLDLPAAVIVETVQGEGGVNVARPEWLRALRALCDDHGIVLIVDDIQIGIGRSGDFFSFEQSGIVPDVVTLSKSLSGYGFPMSLVLIKPEFDVWKPAMHTGTFRGNSIAFVGAAAAIENYWADASFPASIAHRGDLVASRLAAIADRHAGAFTTRGRGLLQGLAGNDLGLAGRISKESFARGLIVETSGAHDEVLKVMPTLVGDDETLLKGLDIIDEATDAAIAAA